MILYLKHLEIDKVKWDECIGKSLNRLLYAQSWFLDIVSPGWEALVEDDYTSVMPLPVKRKFFIPYLVQPVLTQQLGVFSIRTLSAENVNEFIKTIPAMFFRQVFNLNSSNELTTNKWIINRVNFELDLNRSYPMIYETYHENTRRNVKKAIKNGVRIELSTDADKFLACYRQFARNKPSGFVMEKLKMVMRYAIDHQKGEIIFARNNEDRVTAGALFLKEFGRIIYLASFTMPEGQRNSAMFLVMDTMIKKHAMSPVIFDFEGSMIPGIARFFAGFGAEKKGYQQYRRLVVSRKS